MKHLPIKFSTHAFLYTKLVLFFLSLLVLSSCGSSQASLESARRACRKGSEQLKHRIGPEFSRLVSITPLPLSNSQYGCAFVYTKILEELPGEVLGSYVSATEPHELAFVIPDFEGRLILNQPNRPKFRQGPVEITVKLAEIRQGSPPEIIVEERDIDSQSPIYAMRIFMYAEGVPVPKEIFSERLSIRLDNGIERQLNWLLADIEGLPAIILKDRSTTKEKVYMWHESLQSYRYDLAVTQRRTVSPNATQLRLNSKKDLRPKAITPLPSSIHLPKSLVPVIEEDQEEMNTKSSKSSIDKQKTKKSQGQSSMPQSNGNKRKRKDKQVTTAKEFLEGL